MFGAPAEAKRTVEPTPETFMNSVRDLAAWGVLA
jgi:hypothetical protein